MFGIKDLGPVTPLEETPSSAQHGVRSDKTLLLSKGRLTQSLQQQSWWQQWQHGFLIRGCPLMQVSFEVSEVSFLHKFKGSIYIILCHEIMPKGTSVRLHKVCSLFAQ